MVTEIACGVVNYGGGELTYLVFSPLLGWICSPDDTGDSGTFTKESIITTKPEKVLRSLTAPCLSFDLLSSDPDFGLLMSGWPL